MLLFRKGVFMDLSKVLASSLRHKYLEGFEKREMQVMKLVSSVGSTDNELNRNLLILEKEGIDRTNTP